MQNSQTAAAGQHIEVGGALISEARQRSGRGLIIAASLALAAIIIMQSLYAAGAVATGFENWRPVLYAYVLWAVALGVGQVMVRGEAGHRALFLLPALLFTIVMVIFLLAGTYFIARAIRREMEVSRMQSEFVSAVSHEFRSPLTSIRQLSEMLLAGRVPSEDRRHKYHGTLVRETHRRYFERQRRQRHAALVKRALLPITTAIGECREESHVEARAH